MFLRNLLSMSPAAFAIGIGLAALLAADPVTPVPSPAPLTGEVMYLRAIAAFRAVPQPPFVAYRADYLGQGAFVRCTDGQTRVTFGKGEQSSAYRVWFRNADAQAIRLDLATNQRCAGAPLLSPSGGDIAALVKSTPPPAAPGASQSSEPRIISEMRVESALYYRVTSVREEEVEGHATHHLTLAAYNDAPRHPLTDLWLDIDTYLVRRVTGDFADRYSGAPARIVATGTFDRFGPFWIMKSEHVEFAASTRPAATRATFQIDGSDFSFPETAPDVFK